MPYAAGVATVATAVEIRDVRGAAELRECQALQRRVWGITEDGYLLPVATMSAAQRVGGSVLGAFNADGRLLGFAFAFLGRLAERDILYSQLAAVHPDAQGSGLGLALLTDGLRWMRLRGARSAFVNTQADNARALQLDERAGFRRLPVGRCVLGRDLGRCDADLERPGSLEAPRPRR